MGDGTGTHASGGAEAGHGTTVETAAQGLVDAGPAGAAVLVQGAATGAGRGYWWRTGPGLRHCSRLGVEAEDD